MTPVPKHHEVRALLVDPSLFTAPYDTALTHGLLSSGVDVVWATRPTRQGDRQELPIERTDTFFYRRTDEAEWVPERLKSVVKGIAHMAGLLTLLGRIRRMPPDVVHVQWIVVPPLDMLAMALIGRRRPLVLTVHDTVPFNGQPMSWIQRMGFDGPLRCAHRLIVHTRSGRQALIDRGVAAEKITVIPHGPLQLAVPLPPEKADRDPRWTFLLFGEIKPYKGLDELVEAVGLMPESVRARARVIVAGRPRMDLAPVQARIQELGLTDQFELRPHRQSEEEMAELFGQTDCVLFPYRQIDASGVYFLVKALGKWLIASKVGVFAEEVVPGVDGELVPREDPVALAQAMQHAVEQRPRGRARPVADSWVAIGQATRAVYREAMLSFEGAPQGGRRNVLEE